MGIRDRSNSDQHSRTSALNSSCKWWWRGAHERLVGGPTRAENGEPHSILLEIAALLRLVLLGVLLDHKANPLGRGDRKERLADPYAEGATQGDAGGRGAPIVLQAQLLQIDARGDAEVPVGEVHLTKHMMRQVIKTYVAPTRMACRKQLFLC